MTVTTNGLTRLVANAINEMEVKIRYQSEESVKLDHLGDMLGQLRSNKTRTQSDKPNMSSKDPSRDWLKSDD